MLTIFSIPKPFEGHIGTIQTNAIQSWLRLRPECEVILFGNEEGVAKAASGFGIRHIPYVERNEYGTPLVNSIFDIAQNISSHQLICYVNTDIILMSDFLLAIRRIHRKPFLLIGQRWDIDLKEKLDFSKPDWEECLRTYLAKAGRLHGPSGLDYFVFPSGLYHDIPPFAIGRVGWDNWMVYKARSLGVSVIDATDAITVVHQNHDYSHLSGGEAELWEGPEAERNRELLGGKKHAFYIRHVNLVLTAGGHVIPAVTRKHLYLRLLALYALFPWLHPLGTLAKALVVKLIKTVKSVSG